MVKTKVLVLNLYDFKLFLLGNEIVRGIQELIEREIPIIIIVENDMAKVLGQAIYSLLNFEKDIVCIDGIKVENGDYIDIGKPVAEGKVLPVVIKTLVFN